MVRQVRVAIALMTLVLVPAFAAFAQDMGIGPFSVTDHPTLGRILADPDGKTLYTWAGDTAGAASACNDACATPWPPYLVDEGMAMTMNDPSIIHPLPVGAIQRNDGKYQAALNGWPLYYFVRDAARGDANGEGATAFGALWSVVKADDMMM
jgi:predicted lipoprotein with Yx(FWY)xxD motif